MKFIYNLNYKNNQNHHNYLCEKEIENQDIKKEKIVYSYFKNFKKLPFLYKKTFYGRRYNINIKSLKRNKNFDLNNLLINSWIKKGLKLNFLKHYNNFYSQLMWLFITEKQYFQQYPNYDFIFESFRKSCKNYKLDLLLVNPVKELQHMFDLKLKKLNKKMKKKYKKKYIYSVKYLHKTKRLKHALSTFYPCSNNYSNKKYSERIFNTFLYVLFDTKNSPIWEKKLNIYKVALKFLKKR